VQLQHLNPGLFFFLFCKIKKLISNKSVVPIMKTNTIVAVAVAVTLVAGFGFVAADISNPIGGNNTTVNQTNTTLQNTTDQNSQNTSTASEPSKDSQSSDSQASSSNSQSSSSNYDPSAPLGSPQNPVQTTAGKPRSTNSSELIN
jgi:cytoskeletal protein RodZ